MTISQTISKIDKALEQTTNYHWLKKVGMNYIQQLSGKLWTDYNTHDPGITILELLCFSITDLSYRTSLSIEDLLANPDENQQHAISRFSTALHILPNRPVQINDYRKLLIDIEGIKNAWLETTNNKIPVYLNLRTSKLAYSKPINAPYKPVPLSGLYNVIIEFEEYILNDQKPDIIAEAHKRLQSNRNLCEDFVGISQVKQQEFKLCAKFELKAEADVNKLEARVFYEVQRFLTPGLNKYTLAEMVSKSKTVDEIFEGPLFKNNNQPFDYGFVDTDELEDTALRTRIHLSDIINVIMNIPDVLAVKDIVFLPVGDNVPENDNKWDIPVTKGYQPRLNHNACRLIHYKDVLAFNADDSKVNDILNELNLTYQASLKSAKIEDVLPPIGQYAETDFYESIANEFPLNYGIGEAGLPKDVSKLRKAQANQLGVYLHFFDQLMANYLAQLTNVKQLFSLDPQVKNTYFSQLVEGIHAPDSQMTEAFEDLQTLNEIAENPETFDKRRNIFLNHLLSRFNEKFNEYVQMMYALKGETANNEDIINDKINFLKDYPALSSGRGLAFNITDKDELWDTFNVSGMQHRIARLTGIANYSRRNLAKISYRIYDENDDDEIVEYRFRIVDKDNDKILISGSTHYLPKKEALREMRKSVELGFELKNYDKKQAIDGRFYFNIVDENQEVIGRRIEYFKEEEDCDAAIKYLHRFLHENYSGEGMFVVEHLLLRSQNTDEPLMPVCVGQSGKDCPDTDPYSFRISVVLPAWEKRFEDMNFRNFFEKTVRLETPAHILPRICWVNEEQMSDFEDAYKDWLFAFQQRKLKHKKYKTVTKHFIKILSSLKSIYPEGTLHDCIDGNDANPVVLGHTTIGSQINK